MPGLLIETVRFALFSDQNVGQNASNRQNSAHNVRFSLVLTH